ncbi:MAG TPA: PAC2 family protein [Nitrososphaera sp.]|nr:PAC2 family protein [Nitrososphaera sp.]
MIGLKVHRTPQLSGPSRIVAALPDMGNVAGIGLAYLAKKLDAKVFAELYSFWPPFVSYKDGIVDYKQASYRFYAVDESNLLIFTGDFNPGDPRRLYEVCYEVLGMAQRMNVSVLYSIGAALRQPGTGGRVFAAVNNPALVQPLKDAGAEMLQGEGQISGFNGLVLGLAKERGIDAACMLGEIDNPNIIQPKAAQSILHVLLKVLGLESFDMAQLDEEEKRKKFMEQQVGYLEKVIERGEPPGVA